MKQEEDGAKATNFEIEIEDRGHLALAHWSRLIAIKIPPQKPAVTAGPSRLRGMESDLLFFFMPASIPGSLFCRIPPLL